MKPDKNIYSEHVDNCLVRDFMLVAYPSTLVFGKPFIKNRNFNFIKWTYFIIEPDYYSNWVNAIKTIISSMSERNPEHEKQRLSQDGTFITSWSFKNGKTTFYLEHLNILKFKLDLNFTLLSAFLRAFKQLFFKPLVLKPWAYIPLETLINHKNEDKIKTISLKSAFKIAQKICASKSPQIIHYVAEILLRHKDLLKIAVELSELTIPKIDLASLSTFVKKNQSESVHQMATENLASDIN